MDAEALERLKRASVGQLLFRAARRLNEQTLARVEERTGLAVRPRISSGLRRAPLVTATKRSSAHPQGPPARRRPCSPTRCRS